jgi:hypothetical protein
MSFRVFLEKAQSPNYAFDSWAKSAEKLGTDVDSMVGQAKKNDSELDHKASQSKKDKKTHPQKDDDIDIEKEGAWKKLKEISKERLKKKKEDDAPKDLESSEK